MHVLSGAVVVAFALFLVGLGAASCVRPAQTRRFLGAFAQSARAHAAEMAVRMAVGASLVAHAPATGSPGAFRLVGWVVVGTTAGLALVPWRWHRRFAERVVPPVLRHLRLLGLASVALGIGVLLAVLRGGAT